MKMDLNCYCGNWPFFRVRCNTAEKLHRLHSRCGIEGGIVSSCEAIFYQDPYEAELELAKALEGTPYLHAMVLNPRLPGWQDDLKRAMEKLHIKAVRLLPGFHGYSLEEPVMDEVCNALRSYGLPMLLTLRIRDERTAWMLQPRTIPVEEIAAFLDKNRDITTLLACVRTKELGLLAPQFAGRDNLFADISGLKDGLFSVDTACEAVGAEHIVYGSSAPLLEMQSTAIVLDRSRLSPEARDMVFSGTKFLSLLK